MKVVFLYKNSASFLPFVHFYALQMLSEFLSGERFSWRPKDSSYYKSFVSVNHCLLKYITLCASIFKKFLRFSLLRSKATCIPAQQLIWPFLDPDTWTLHKSTYSLRISLLCLSLSLPFEGTVSWDCRGQTSELLNKFGQKLYPLNYCWQCTVQNVNACKIIKLARPHAIFVKLQKRPTIGGNPVTI